MNHSESKWVEGGELPLHSEVVAITLLGLTDGPALQRAAEQKILE